MATKFGTFEELIDGIPAEQQEIMRQLKAVVLDIYPDSVEVVRMGDNAATYGVGPKKMSEGFCYLMPIKKGYCNLGFYHGVEVDDPEGVLEGTGKRLRHVKIYDVTQAQSDGVRQLVSAALAERQQTLGR